MIRKLLATTAIATLISSGAYAQTTTEEPAETTPPAATDQAPAATDDAAPADDTAASDDAAAPAAGGEVKEAAVVQDGHLASNLIGETVYNGTGDDAENIGDVNDLVVTGEGEVKAIVIGVGGFLGIGEKSVAIDYSTIEWAERDGDRWIVVATTAEQLKELPAFDKTPYEPEPPATAATDTGTTGTGGMGTTMTPPADTATAPAEEPADDMAAAPADDAAEVPADDTAAAPAEEPADDTAAAPADDSASDTAAAPAEEPAEDTAAAPADDSASDTAAAPADDTAAGTDDTETAAIDRSSLKELTTADISAEKLVGTSVYGSNEEDIGEIGDVILSQDGKVDAVIIDVGGFLGVGEKQVAVGMDNLQFMADENGDQYLYTTFTKEQLDAAPAYDESTYAENRDEQRIMMEN